MASNGNETWKTHQQRVHLSVNKLHNRNKWVSIGVLLKLKRMVDVKRRKRIVHFALNLLKNLASSKSPHSQKQKWYQKKKMKHLDKIIALSSQRSVHLKLIMQYLHHMSWSMENISSSLKQFIIITTHYISWKPIQPQHNQWSLIQSSSLLLILHIWITSIQPYKTVMSCRWNRMNLIGK